MVKRTRRAFFIRLLSTFRKSFLEKAPFQHFGLVGRTKA